MAGSLLLLLWVENQLSVDQFHTKKEAIYKVYTKALKAGEIQTYDETPASLSPLLRAQLPEIKNEVRVLESAKSFKYSDKIFKADGNIVDASFLQIFSFPLTEGNILTSFRNGSSILITEKLAKKLFGTEEALNRVITSEGNNFIVSGIIKDLPNNTQFKFDYLLPWEYLNRELTKQHSMDQIYASTFVEIFPNTDFDALNNKLDRIKIQEPGSDQKLGVFFYPFKKTWLHSHFENGKASGGPIDTLKLMGLIAGIILLIACINFMNLSTARSEKRAKEVGVRKLIGADRISLIRQFLGESVFLSAIAGILALCLVELVLPSFNQLTGKSLKIEYISPVFWLAFTGFILFTGVLAGSYPAFYLSSYKPVKIIKGIFKNSNGLVTPRRILVVFQFSFAIILINFTILLQKQITHLKARETGYTKENLVFHTGTDDLRKNYQLLRNDLLNSGAALSVARSNTSITRAGVKTESLDWIGKDKKEKISFALLTSQNDFVKTTGTHLLMGRDINIEKYPSDSNSCMINEAAVKIMGFKNPLGQLVKEGSANWQIVGVLKNFVISNPFQEVAPLFIRGSAEDQVISIRLNNLRSDLENIRLTESILKKYNQHFVTELQFADTDYAQKIKGINLTSTLTNIFTGIAIFISCLGLFGLVTFIAETKTKEIGVRKVLGARIVDITALLVKGFAKLVLLSILIATPLAWLLMNAFLRPFYYRVNISWYILLEAGILTLLMTTVTTSIQSVRAASKNPANSLRTE